MELTCSPQSFSCPLRLPQIPVFFLLMMSCLPSATDLAKNKEPLQVSGEVGGEVVFRCPFAKQRSVTSLYFQKKQEFVNGFHAFLPINTPTWANTRLDSEYNVHMNQLNVSHAGKYTCHILYDEKTLEETDIMLTVTANYSTPNVTMSCRDHICKVTCTSHGGYPQNKISWDVHALGNPSSQMCKFVENPLECDTKTKLCNISSTASFNCSFGLQRNLSCYVDKTEISSTFSICDSGPLTPEPNSDSPAVLIAVSVVIVLAALGLLLLLLWKIKKRQTGPITESNVEEGHPLKE